MGINYYLYPKSPCKECGRPHEPKHIGKDSSGWCFSLHVIPEEGINDLKDWKKLWNHSGAIIKDECGKKISMEDMEKIITERRGIVFDRGSFWLVQNSAVGGPNGLVRHRIDGKFCTGHGRGTWDFLTGEFS